MNCRHCNSALKLDLIDLGFAPPSNAYLEAADLARPEMYFPLRVKVCEQCWLVQTEDYAQAGELFGATYAYFSSTSSSWLAHAKDYCEKIIPRLDLGRESLVIEVASNDGYLLKNFVAAGVPCLGIEPTASTAAAAEKLGFISGGLTRVKVEVIGRKSPKNLGIVYQPGKRCHGLRGKAVVTFLDVTNRIVIRCAG